MNELAWTKRIYLFLRQYADYNPVFFGRERQLWDRSRVDLLTAKSAIEVDWAYKQYEAIGQACWYAHNFQRQPCVCLLVKDFDNDYKAIYRCQVVCAIQKIDVWLVDVPRNTINIAGNVYPLPEAD